MIKAIARCSLLAFVPVFVVCLCILQSPSFAKTWRVGPTQAYKKPSLVMSLVTDGDTVLIDSGLYQKDVGVWRAKHLVLRCPVGFARLDAEGTAAAKKGIWVIDGDSTYVEGIEFSGCGISEADGSNGAGIRFESHKLECRHCIFRDNQEGILTGNDTTNEITIEACEFDHNGVETGGAAGFEHNIYVGHSRSCTIRFCYFHRSIVGHEIKSRANRTNLLYNYIVDGPDGDGSYSIDLPNGGIADIIGNIIEKGPRTANSTVISYGEEGLINPEKIFVFGSNTVVTDRTPTTFLHIADGLSTSIVANNIFAGGLHLMTGAADTINNVIEPDTTKLHFRDPSAYDYHIVAAFRSLDTLYPLTSIDNLVLWPQSEYVHPLDSSAILNPYYIGALAPVVSSGVRRTAVPSSLCSYPDPFTSSTSIALPSSVNGQRVTFSVLDALGKTIYQSTTVASRDVLPFERGSLPAGTYQYFIESNGSPVASGRMVAR